MKQLEYCSVNRISQNTPKINLQIIFRAPLWGRGRKRKKKAFIFICEVILTGYFLN